MERDKSPYRKLGDAPEQNWNEDGIPLLQSCDFERGLMLKALYEGNSTKLQKPFIIETLQVNDTNNELFGAMQIEVKVLQPLRYGHLAALLGGEGSDRSTNNENSDNGLLIPEKSTVVFFPPGEKTREDQLTSLNKHGLIQAPLDQGIVVCFAVAIKALEAGMSLTKPHQKDWTKDDQRGFDMLVKPIQTLLLSLCDGCVWSGNCLIKLYTDPTTGKPVFGVTHQDFNSRQLVLGQFPTV